MLFYLKEGQGEGGEGRNKAWQAALKRDFTLV